MNPVRGQNYSQHSEHPQTSNGMKVLIATGIYPPESGGPATYAKLLRDELPKYGIEVAVLAFREVRHFPKLVRHLAYAWKVFRMGRGMDAIYAQDTMSVGVPTRLANVFLRKKNIVRVPGDHVWEQGMQRYGITDTLDTFPAWSWQWHPVLMGDRKSTRLNSSHPRLSRMPSSA